MIRVKIYPQVDFLHAFLQTRGFLLVPDKENILHYTGQSLKELMKLLKEDKPDLLVIHSKDFDGKFPTNFFWIYHPLKIEKDIYCKKKLLTNSYRLCQHYYQKLGLQKEIEVVEKPQEKKKNEVNFGMPDFFIRKAWFKICQIMFWQ